MNSLPVYLLVQTAFDEALHQTYPELDSSSDIAIPKEASFGDYQCMSAMKLAKTVNLAPRAFAEKMLPHLKNNPLFSAVSLAGPGFINVTIAPSFWLERLNALVNTASLIVPSSTKERIVVDFSSPNVAKEMHVGHLRSTIIGDAIARLLEARGHEVLRQNHIGDWGTSFGMLIAHIQSLDHYQELLKKATLFDLMQLYRASKVRFDEDPLFKKTAQKAVVELQSGNQDSLAIWKVICDISRKAYQEIYDLLDIKIEERGESFYNAFLPMIVGLLEGKGLVELSDGAKCIYVPGVSDREHSKLPLIIQKSDGGYNYDTTDMAALWYRITKDKADRIICVTDAGQSLHFQLIFSAGLMAGWYDPSKLKLNHVGFGMVLAPSGKKFKTRSGETEKLKDLLDAACQKAKEIIDTRNPEWPEEQKEALAPILGLGAVKYSDLSCNRLSDYTFSYERMLRFDGNTAAFIMYSHVRAKSILIKVQSKKNTSIKKLCSLSHPSELALAKHLALFNDTLVKIEEELMPHRLTDYLYTLAELFNHFFRDCRVEGDEKEDERALLVELTQRTLQEGLCLLGIKVPERM